MQIVDLRDIRSTASDIHYSVMSDMLPLVALWIIYKIYQYFRLTYEKN